jgi:PAS domain S-box-containing protein
LLLAEERRISEKLSEMTVMNLEPEPAQKTATRILYMEDDHGLAILFKKRLERLGFAVDLAADGEEGLRLFERDPWGHDIIAVDQNMPGIDGLEVIKILTTYNPVPPILMVTGNGDERVAVEAMKLGARDYIVKDIDGGYLELMPSVIDKVLTQQRLVDEKRRAEETLRQSEERYRSLVELSPDGIVVYSDDHFVYVNDAAIRLLNAPNARAVIGCAVSDVLHPDCYPAVWSKLQRTQLHGENVTLLEGKLLRFDNEVVDVEIMAAPIMFENRAATQMLLREVTERKRAEEMQREGERLRIALEKEKELGDLKTKFMITISHEFRTPLSVAYASSELLERYYERMQVPQRQEHLHRIESQIRKMTEMMDDITQIVHARFERLVLNFEPTDLRRLSEKVLVHLREGDEDAQRITFMTDDQLPNVMLDVRRIKYVLTNLLTNALKYSEDGEVALRVLPQGDGIVIEVTDSGIGIPAEDQAHIFDPFYRAHNVGVVHGTGLGLSIVKEIVEMHSGTITLKSEVGQGTQIAVYLPRTQKVERLEKPQE